MCAAIAGHPNTLSSPGIGAVAFQKQAARVETGSALPQTGPRRCFTIIESPSDDLASQKWGDPRFRLLKRRARTFLILATTASALLGLLGLPLGLTSFFLFDAPGSENNRAVIVLFWSALTLSIVCLLSIALSWLLYARKHVIAACSVSLVPAVNVFFGAAAMSWLAVFHHGLL
jgi:hypothetical protein